jgi:3-methyladenine DNA glycosylase/8-oxoguanine DNA glycosylase
VSGLLSYETLTFKGNDEVVAALMEIPGIGRWTAEMFLIFGLMRPDVLALGDAGLQRAAKMLYPKSSSNGNALEKVNHTALWLHGICGGILMWVEQAVGLARFSR